MDPIKGEQYRGPSGVARDSQWLTNEDLPGERDVVVEIESVTLYKDVTFQAGRTKAKVLSIKFKGKERELALNATNRKVLALLFGTATADWYGQRIALYVEQDVRRPDGSRGPAVRIRAKAVEPTPAAREPGAD